MASSILPGYELSTSVDSGALGAGEVEKSPGLFPHWTERSYSPSVKDRISSIGRYQYGYCCRRILYSEEFFQIWFKLIAR